VFITNDCVLMNVAYRNFGDMVSKPPTGCVKHGIYALILKEIIFDVAHFNIPHFM